MREAHDSFKVSDLALQIKESINNMPKDKVLRGNKIREVDEYLIRYEQQIKGRKLLSFDSIKKEWDRIKIMAFFDPSEMVRELERLHREVNKKVLDEIAKREAINEKDISHLKILKIASALLIVFLVFIAMQLDTIQSKQQDELLKRLQDLEAKKDEILDPKLISNSPENIRHILDNI